MSESNGSRAVRIGAFRRQLRVHCVVLATLTLLFGLHILRVFLPLVFWYLGRWLTPTGLALYALGTFALTLLAPLVRRRLGEGVAMVLSVGGIALVRLAIQLVRAPLADLALATAGLGLLGWFLPMWCQSRRNCLSKSELPILAVAFPLAFLLDTGSRALLLSYDLAWRASLEAALVVLGLVAATLVVLWIDLRTCPFSQGPGVDAEEPTLSWVMPLLGLGPWLYLAMNITHNPAVLAAMTSWGYTMTQVALMLFTTLGALASVWVAGWTPLQRWTWAGFGSVLMVGALAFLVMGIGPGWLWVGVASLNAWAALGEVLTSTARTGSLRPGLWRSGLAIFGALATMLALVILIDGYDISWMTPIAGAILGLAALWATRVDAGRDGALLRSRGLLVGAAAAVVLLAVGGWSLWQRPGQVVEMLPQGQPLRVMTYNIHHGIDADNSVDLEAIADVIAAENPDVIVLNEVNRARISNGFVDTLPLIGRRLRMRYVFGANHADGQYGNAILSRYPILEWDNTRFRHKTTEVRGLLRAVIQTGSGPVTIFGTHLDHVEGPSHVRSEQVLEALDVWGDAPRTVLVGDLNAQPDAAELQRIYQAGFVDVLAATGQDDVFTYWESEPSRRIDFIFQTPDLALLRAWVVPSRASDHLPVLAELLP